LIAYTISAAIDSGVFSTVMVSTDSEEAADIGRHYGAEVPFLRPAEISTDTSPDIDWVKHALGWLREQGREPNCFSILRPTSPFRKPGTIQRAWSAFNAEQGAEHDVDSLRAVEKCRQHPAKMWVLDGGRMIPVMDFGLTKTPWHSSQYTMLPEVYVQNASLEIAWSRVATEGHTIAGEVLMPFLTEGDEGLDVNDQHDWDLIELLLQRGEATLPKVSTNPYVPSGGRA
jgi:N-acylneuraminate cytidylyltransferase